MPFESELLESEIEVSFFDKKLILSTNTLNYILSKIFNINMLNQTYMIEKKLFKINTLNETYIIEEESLKLIKIIDSDIIKSLEKKKEDKFKILCNFNNFNNFDMALKKIINFCDYHGKHPCSKIVKPLQKDLSLYLSAWDNIFLKDIDKDFLVDLVSLSNHLNCRKLTKLLCAKTANNIKNLTQDEMIEYFKYPEKIDNDYENEWF